jgi:PAS domain S-box-containing protein
MGDLAMQIPDELRSLEARFAGMLELAEDAVISVDADQRITLFNRAAEKTFGYTAAEVLGQPLELLLPDRAAASHRQLVEGFDRSPITARRMGELREVFGRRKDGSEFPAEASISKLDLPSGKVFTAFLRDVTERRRSEAARKQAEDALAEARVELARVARVTTMGELAASIAHEVNQPLAAVITNASACLRWLAAAPSNIAEANAALQRIVRDANRASEVIARIRAFLKRGEPRKTQLQVDEIVREVVSLVQGEARTRDVTMRVESTAGLPPVLADQVEVQQVLLNLILNAIEAMSAIKERARVLEVATAKYGPDAIVVAVRDSGPGLEPQHMERIFDAFYTTKPQGMGMGLAISRSIIDAHGGRLWALPNQGPGATFQFTLPVGVGDAA